MELEIIEDNESKLLKRREILVRVSFTGATPNRLELRNAVIKELKSDPELTILDSLKQRFGETSVVCYVKVYDNKDAMKVERPTVLKKNFELKEKPEKAAEGEATTDKKDETEKVEEVGVAEESEQKDESPEELEKPAEEAKDSKDDAKPEKPPEEGETEEKPKEEGE